jgi:adenine phosphoribosyltransferase
MKITDLFEIIPDYPKPGILFYDINPLLSEDQGLHMITNQFLNHFDGKAIEKVVSIEARGFIFGAALAYAMGVGFVPLRKPKKLPGELLKIEYQKEYGKDFLELQKKALKAGERVILIDDILASGGTLNAGIELINQVGVNLIGIGVVLELLDFKARNRFHNVDLFALHQIGET